MKPSTIVKAKNDRLISASTPLEQEHRRLEATYEALLRAYAKGDWPDVLTIWQVFERDLLTHLDIEETRILPLVRESSSGAAAAIVEEHAVLRHLLGQLASGIELHVLSAAQASGFLERLRSHGRRECARRFELVARGVL